MALRVVVGAGGTGVPTALRFADAGDEVRLISRRGTGPDHPRITRIAADATDTDRLTDLTTGAATLLNCAMPPYDRWPREWPPLAASLLTAAERTGADYVIVGNFYGYGPVTGPLTEDLPMAPTSVKGRVRAQMWEDALAAHRAGRVRVTEVRASDLLGARAASVFGFVVLPAVLAGDVVRYPGDLDAPHPWTYTGDVAATLTAVSNSDVAWGRAWHVPSPNASVRQVATLLAEITGAPMPKLERLSRAAVTELGRSDPIIAELPEVMYLDEQPLFLDSTVTEQTFGVTASPLRKMLEEMVAAAQA